MSGIAILEDMGKQLGFTAFYESNGKVLIVPAVDPKKLTEPGNARGSAQVVEGAPGAGPTGAKPAPAKPAGAKQPGTKPEGAKPAGAKGGGTGP